MDVIPELGKGAEKSVQDHLWLHRELEAILGYTRVSKAKQSKTKHTKGRKCSYIGDNPERIVLRGGVRHPKSYSV